MRRVLLVSGVALGALLLGMAALFLLVDPNSFRGQIAGELQKQLHRPVNLGKMSLSLYPLGVGVEDLAIGEKPEIPTVQPFQPPLIRQSSCNLRGTREILLHYSRSNPATCRAF